MKTALSEFIAEINRTRKSGLLSITVKGANTQLKMFFREGEVYHVTCGHVKGAECLAQATEIEFAECFFMPEVSLNVHDGNLPPLADIIRFFKTAGTAVEIRQPDGKAAQPAGPGAAGISDFAGIREELKTALIRQIGPAGGKILSKVIEEKWRVSSPTRADLMKLIGLLKDEVEDGENRNQFTEEAEKIISFS
jgi:hypothetical protein